MKRTFLFSMVLFVAFFALASQSARANEITVSGTTSSTTPNGITFTLGSFNGTTAGGFAAFSNLGSYTLTTTPGTYNTTLSLTIVFTLPVTITGGATTSFTANVFGNVVNNTTGGVDILFTNPSQTFSFSNSGGSGVFTFNLNSVSMNPGGTTALSGFVNNASFTPVPEPSSLLLLGAGLLLMPLLRIKRPC